MISKRAKARVIDLINSGVEQGAELLLDGRNVQVQGYESGNFVGATIFSGVNTDMRIYKEEIFGPVLSIICVDTLDEAIALINANPFGNGVGLFTKRCHCTYFPKPHRYWSSRYQYSNSCTSAFL